MKNMKPMKHYLFCPGPVNVAESVKQAVIAHEIGHRETEFSALLEQLNNNILDVFEIRNKKRYFSVVITGSGSAANEAVLSSVVGNKTILVLSNGEFGNRLHVISSLHNKKTKYISFGWGNHFDLSVVEKYLQKHKVDFVAMVHHETSSGLLNPVAEVGKIAKKNNAQLILDTVSSAGADRIDLEKWNVAFCTTSASKALGSLAGVSIVVGKETEFKKIKHSQPKSLYLHLYKFYQYAKKSRQTPNTPAVPLFFALNRALENILEIGVEQYRQRQYEAATSLRKVMKELDLAFLVEESYMSNVLTTVKLPKGMTFAHLRDALREVNIIIYNGKGPFKNKVFQVGNIGELSQEDINYFISNFQRIIRSHLENYTQKRPGMRKAISTKKTEQFVPSFPTLQPIHLSVINRTSSAK